MYTELPPVEENAYALSVNQTPNKLIVAVRGKSNHPQAPYRLTLRSGEQIYYQAAWNPQSQDLIFDKSKFLSGILRIELTDKQGEIISERPVFLLNNNQIAISNTVNKQKEHLELILKLTFQDQPLTGSYSVYVTESTGNHSSNQLFALYPTDDMLQQTEYADTSNEKILYTHPLQPLSPQGELSIRMPIKQLHSETLTVSIQGNTEEGIMIQGGVQIKIPR